MLDLSSGITRTEYTRKPYHPTLTSLKSQLLAARCVCFLVLVWTIPLTTPLQIEIWSEINYPTFVYFPNGNSTEITFDPSDARTKLIEKNQKFDDELAHNKRVAEIRKRGGVSNGNGAVSNSKDVSMTEMLMYVGAAFICLLALSMGCVWIAVKYLQD